MRRPLIVGNWKMHGDGGALPTIAAIAAAARTKPQVDVALCVPATLIHRAAAIAPALAIGGQDCHAEDEGAHTGSIAALMLRDAGASLVILGHSERRAEGDTDAMVAGKVAAARAAGLDVVLCVGEVERGPGALDQVRDQLRRSLPSGQRARLTIAYEPVWAIGRGILPAPADVAQIVTALRAEAGDARILYGGSVTADAVSDMIQRGGVDGLLVGKASLSEDSFTAILEAADATVALPARRAG